MKKPSNALHAVMMYPLALLLTEVIAYLTGSFHNDLPGICFSQLMITLFAWGAGPALLKAHTWEKPGSGRKPAPVWYMYAAVVLLGFSMQVLLCELTDWWMRFTGTEYQSGIPMPDTGIQLLFVLVTTAVMPAIVEEWFFRGMMLRGLKQSVGLIPSIILSTAAFALAHHSTAALPANLMLGAAAAFLAVWSGRMDYSVLLHMSYNLTAIALTVMK